MPRLCAPIALALTATAAGCYPEFLFSGEGGTGGAPTTASGTARVAVGAGGDDATTAPTTTVTTGPTTTTSTSTGMPGSTSTGPAVIPQVSCGPPQLDANFNWFLTPCEPGQVCCFDQVNALGDHCGSGCDPAFEYTYQCDGPQDCNGADMCCAMVSGNDVVSTACVPACGSPNIVLCETTADCPTGSCGEAFGDPGYSSAYLACQ